MSLIIYLHYITFVLFVIGQEFGLEDSIESRVFFSLSRPHYAASVLNFSSQVVWTKTRHARRWKTEYVVIYNYTTKTSICMFEPLDTVRKPHVSEWTLLKMLGNLRRWRKSWDNKALSLPYSYVHLGMPFHGRHILVHVILSPPRRNWKLGECF